MKRWTKIVWTSLVLGLVGMVISLGVSGSIYLAESVGPFVGIPLIIMWVIFGISMFVHTVDYLVTKGSRY